MSSGPQDQLPGSQSQPQEDESLALGVASKRKEQRRASSKSSIARGPQPLRVEPSKSKQAPDRAFRQAWKRTAGELSEGEQRAAVVQALEVFRLLPPASSYAQHRIRVLEKALQLLDKGGSERSEEEKDELQQLLSQLKI